MKRHELWAKIYRTNPYLEKMADEDLNQRCHDILANSVTITPEGKIGASAFEEGGAFWMQRLTDVLEELGSRGRDLRTIGKDWEHLPTPDTVRGGPGAHALGRLGLEEGQYLVKYGQRQYLEPFTRKGELLVSPASRYDDPSLDPARADSELTLDLDLHPRFFDELYPDLGETIQPITNFNVRWSADTNYYVACFAQSFEHRLFGDFGDADAAVVIYDVPEFVSGIREAFHTQVGEWLDVATSVQYVDPALPGDGGVNVFVSKHFRYTYQREFRLAWKPPENVSSLAPVLLEVDLDGAGVRTELVDAFVD